VLEQVQPLGCQKTTPGLFLQMEKVHLAAELAVVALLGLLERVR
jgi:hypothetical protein